MRQDPGLDIGLTGSAYLCVTARGPEKKVHRQGQKQSGEEQGNRGTETTGWDLSVAAPFTKRWAALRRQLIFALMILFRWKFTVRAHRADPSMGCRSAKVIPGMGGQGPLCPCLLKCTAQPMQGGSHPSISQGKVSNPPADEGTPLHCRTVQTIPQQPWKVPVLSSTARQQRPAAALSGQDFPENVHEIAKVTFREGAAGIKRPVGTVGQAESGTESRSQRQVCRAEESEKTENSQSWLQDSREQRLSRGG